MIKDYRKQLNTMEVILDGIMLAASYALAYYLITLRKNAIALPARFYFTVLTVVIPVYLIINAFNGVYADRSIGRRKELINIVRANSIGAFIFVAILYLGAKNPYLYNFSRRLVIYFHIFAVISETAERYLIRLLQKDIVSKGINAKNIVLIGYSRAAEGFIDRIRRNPEWGYRIKGILDDHKEAGFEYKGIKVIGRIKELNSILEKNTLEEIAITLSLQDYDYLEEIVNDCERSGVHTKFIPDYNNIIPTVPQIEDVQGLPVINIRRLPLSELPNGAIKRVIDIIGALFGLLIFSPVMLITVIAIKLTSKGPVFFVQERVGKHNKIFKMYKFRSMVVQEDTDERKEWTTRNDPRVTPVGRIIRSTSIDEMPQFWNILIGDMSLVGPRPERPQFVEKFREEIPHYMIKHQVRPGLTGWAQVSGYRGDTSIELRIQHDLYYIENWTLGFDIKILFLTLFRGFINKNAY